MTVDALHNTIRGRFQTVVATPLSLPTAYDNAAFTRPQAAPWARWTVLPGESFQASFGGATNRYRTPGVAVAQLFVPIETGDKVALEMAQAVKAAFRGVAVGGVTFREPSVTRVGRVDDEYQINVTCPWQADDIA